MVIPFACAAVMRCQATRRCRGNSGSATSSPPAVPSTPPPTGEQDGGDPASGSTTSGSRRCRAPARLRPRAAVERFKLSGRTGAASASRFLDGLADVQEKVAAIAKESEDVANLHLDFVAGTTAELRISFAEKGFSWSTVGTRCR